MQSYSDISQNPHRIPGPLCYSAIIAVLTNLVESNRRGVFEDEEEAKWLLGTSYEVNC